MLQYLELIQYKIVADLRAEMARAHLGLMWWVLEPLLYMAVFYVVFEVIFQRGGPGYIPYLITGLIVWRWFDNCVRLGALSINQNRALMQQVYVPKITFPTVVILTSTLKFLMVFALLLAFLLIYGVGISLHWMSLPVILATQLVLTAAVASLTALIVPFVPDFRILLNNGLTMMMFISGVFFKSSHVPEPYLDLFYANPIAVLISSYRDVLIDATWPAWERLGVIAGLSVLAYAAVFRLFQKTDRALPKIVS